MITAVDTSVLIDIFRNDPTFAQASAIALRKCIQEGQVVACDIVWAELAGFFPSRTSCEEAMNTISVGFSPLNRESALAAGEVWRRYRVHGGPRARVIPDFLIGAHAALQCERLLSRDRGFYREYFKRLRLLDPTGGD